MSQHLSLSRPSHALPSRSIPIVEYPPVHSRCGYLARRGSWPCHLIFCPLASQIALGQVASLALPSPCAPKAIPSPLSSCATPILARCRQPPHHQEVPSPFAIKVCSRRVPLSPHLSTLTCHLPARSLDGPHIKQNVFSFAPPLAPISTLPVSPVALSSAHPSSPSRPPFFSPLPPIATLLRPRRPVRNDRSFAECLHPATQPSALIALDLTILTPTSARTAAGGVADGRITPRRGFCADSTSP